MTDEAVVHGPVTYEARLRPSGAEWQAEIPCCDLVVTAASPEAAEQALAEALADLRAARFPTRSGMPAPQPLPAEAGWSVVSVSPARRPATPAMLAMLSPKSSADEKDDADHVSPLVYMRPKPSSILPERDRQADLLQEQDEPAPAVKEAPEGSSPLPLSTILARMMGRRHADT